VKVFWLRIGEYLYEASEEYILEGKHILAYKQVVGSRFRRLWHIVDTSVFSLTLASPR
jgi:hypothetical protein